VLTNLGDRLDEDLAAAVFEAATLRTSDIRDELDRIGLAYQGREGPPSPTIHDLDHAADRVIRRSARIGAVGGAVAGIGGLAAVPAEAAGSLVHSIRTGQRLAVIYGHDPATDRGRLLLARALAAAFDLELPDGRALGMRVRDLPRIARDELVPTEGHTTWMFAMLSRGAYRSARGRLLRGVPGLGATVGLWSAHRQSRHRAALMKSVLRAAWDGGGSDLEFEDAVEVPG
jgi:hypothetical protein